MTRSSNRPVLAVEELDQRNTPAGHVSAFLSHGSLVVNGDALANRVSIRMDAAGRLVVVGLNGTKINGKSFESFGLQNNLTGMIVNLRAGNDFVQVVGLHTNGNASIATAQGQDAVSLTGVAIGGNVTINTGADNDLVSLNGIDASAVSADGGTGRDGLHLSNVSALVAHYTHFEFVF